MIVWSRSAFDESSEKTGVVLRGCRYVYIVSSGGFCFSLWRPLDLSRPCESNWAVIYTWVAVIKADSTTVRSPSFLQSLSKVYLKFKF